MRGRVFDISGNRWKQRKPYDGNALIDYRGLSCRTPDLRDEGWTFEIVTNLFTSKSKLYMRHKELKMVARCEYQEGETLFFMDFLTHEKNARISHPKYREVEDGIIEMTYENIGLILEEVGRLQKENQPPARRRPADVFEFIKERKMLS